jgi:F-type H+-transporting ATPase subunit alpha
VIGSILDSLGNLILTTSKADANYRWVIESPAPGIIERQSVFEPLQTGIISIDSMVPIGLGQRELVVGDRQSGKTSIGIDTILNQKYSAVLAVYVPIGQKAASVLEVFLSLVRRDAIFFLSLLVASASASAVCQFLCAYTGIALSEFFMLLRELPAFIMLDDLSRHAVAYREIYLLLRRPPGREAYPGEIFFVHSRLLERSAKLASVLGGGSVTAFPVIETLAGDVSAYITTNVISITDGQIFLSIDLFLSGIKPAIDVGLSVTRVGSAAQWDGMKLVAGSYKLELAQFAELQAFSQFASDLGDDTKSKLARGKRLIEMLKQFCGSPMPLSSQIGILSLANQDVISELEIPEVSGFIQTFLSVPTWVFIYLPVRIISRSVVQLVKSNALDLTLE